MKEVAQIIFIPPNHIQARSDIQYDSEIHTCKCSQHILPTLEVIRNMDETLTSIRVKCPLNAKQIKDGYAMEESQISHASCLCDAFYEAGVKVANRMQ